MAGLLDIFGSSPDIYAGLLGEEGMAQAKRQAQSDALLNLSAALMKAGAPSRTPQGLGLGLVEGMQAAGRGYKESMQGALQEKLAQQKIAEAIASKKRAAGAETLLETLLQPQLTTQSTEGPSGVPYTVSQVTTPNMQDVAGQFAKYGAEGRAALKTYQDVLKSGRPETVTLSEGQQLFERQPDGSLKVVGGAPKIQRLTGEESNIALRLYGTNDPTELAKFPGAAQKISDAAIAQKKAGATNINMPSEGERKAATLASRLNFGVQQMNAAIGTDPTAAIPNTAAEAARFFTQSEFLPNMMNSEQRQIVEAAQEDVLDAALTLGTGAAYTREQLKGYRKSYFPQLGDTEATIKNKQDRLQNLLDSAEIAAGRAAKSITKPETTKPSPVTLTLPDGRKVNFKSKAEADAFRKDAGF